MMTEEIQYPENFTARLQAIWGEGFLSPGGVEEIDEIVRDVDLSGKTVLDIGFGIGGPAIVLAKNHGAKKVIGIDVEAQLLDQAEKIVEKAGVASTVDFRIVKPGTFPFEKGTFNVVFSKDSMVHIQDKTSLFEEIERVLTPGGIFVASDWLSGGDESGKLALKELQEIAHLDFTMASAMEMEKALAKAGFENISSRDRNAWFVPIVNNEVEKIEGPLNKELIDEFGVDVIENWCNVKKAVARAASSGGLRPTHLRAFKPDS